MIAILLVFLSTMSQDAKDVTGFQEYTWGTSRVKITTDLKKSDVSFKTDDDGSIRAQTKFYFDEYPHDIEVEQVFRFYKDSLRAVQYFYRYGLGREQIDTVFNRIRNILISKYGKPTKDTLHQDDAYPFQWIDWKFPSTQIDLLKQYDEKLYKSRLELPDEYIRVSYWSEYFVKRIEEDKQQSMKKKF